MVAVGRKKKHEKCMLGMMEEWGDWNEGLKVNDRDLHSFFCHHFLRCQASSFPFAGSGTHSYEMKADTS